MWGKMCGDAGGARSERATYDGNNSPWFKKTVQIGKEFQCEEVDGLGAPSEYIVHDIIVLGACLSLC